jgi:Zn-dependent protease
MADPGENVLFRAVVYVVPMLLSLTIHEYSHARSAFALGDDTAARQGRMTLNPIAHIDVIGTLVIPLLAMVAGSLPLIGWAKPVPVVPVRFTRKLSMRSGMALVALAGPLSNGILAAIGLVVHRIALPGQPLGSAPGGSAALAAVAYLLYIIVHMNMGLMIFNLLPVPPLDGSRLLPRRLDSFQERIRPYSYVLLMAIMFFLGGFLMLPGRIFIGIASLVLGIPLGGG